MSQTKIEWCDTVFNPVTGCTPVSAGCENCYARRFTQRLAGRCGYPAEDPFRVTLHPERLDEPLRWQKPRRVFVCSMGDLFHEDVPFEFIDQIFAVIALAQQHTFLILTKRPERMKQYLTIVKPENAAEDWRRQLYFASGRDRRLSDSCYFQWPIPNLWLGVTCENQAWANERIPILLQIPAAVRFVSCEPMLEPVTLPPEALGGYPESDEWARHGPHEPRIHWIITGGETGPGARPMHPDWVRSLRDQCQAAGVPFFLKQMHIDGKLVKMPELDGRRWDELPRF